MLLLFLVVLGVWALEALLLSMDLLPELAIPVFDPLKGGLISRAFLG